MKVLIISHNVISTTNNMGKTLHSLFSEFEKEELCQLYIHPSPPDVEVCSSYYCISDEEVLQSIYTSKLPGHQLEQKDIQNPIKRCDFAGKNSSVPLKRLLRDWIWKLSRWDNEKLKQWLEEECPTCIFLAPGYAKFIYDIALNISRRLEIPIITYICDDYYFVKASKGLWTKYQFELLKRKTIELFRETTHLVVINEELKELYSKEFHVETTTIMTGINFEIHEEYKEYKKDSDNVTISYFGNIACNRNNSLAEVGKALDIINKKNGTDYKLKIYTSESDFSKWKVFKDIKAVENCGFVSGERFKKEFFSSDFLIHVEAFDDESIDLVKNSISTKVAELFWSEIPTLVYGPKNVAVIKYIKDNEAAFVIDDPAELVNRLNQILCDETIQHRYLDNAKKLAKNKHDSKKNSRILKMILIDAIQCARENKIEDYE